MECIILTLNLFSLNGKQIPVWFSEYAGLMNESTVKRFVLWI